MTMTTPTLPVGLALNLALALALSWASTAASAASATVVGKPPAPPPPGILFNFSQGDNMVLQAAPQKSCVYGTIVDGGATGATVTISSSSLGVSYDIGASVVPRAGDGNVSEWKACLAPHATTTTHDFTITAACVGCSPASSASISHVAFGEVWYCGGQSNMALPLMHTMSRNISRDMILKGKYDNMRIHGIHGNMNGDLAWSTLKAALATNNDSDLSAFAGYSSTCYYFGESLSDKLAKASPTGEAPPIGLVHTAFGGSSIEQWLTNETIATCANASIGPSNQMWHDARVMPYANMTFKGFVWYQGENDMHNLFGNSALSTGYSCLMKALVKQWRGIWSAEAGTTDPVAPFGLVTLAPSGTEGGSDIGTMRWAQTASYGVLPNPEMPNTFLAQAYDLNDPYRNDSCYGAFKCHDNSVPPQGGYGRGCDGYCASVRTTNWYMGPIHPRDKKPVGSRLADAAAVVAYAAKGYTNGPTLAGCAMAGSKITVTFNKTMMASGGNDAIKIQPYYTPPNQGPGQTLAARLGLGGSPKVSGVGSMMEVLVNKTSFCMQAGGAGCRDDGTGAGFTGPLDPMAWVAVDITAGAAPNEVIVDLARAKGVAYAIRYGWTGDCCSSVPKTSSPCPLASCPIMGTDSALPANPFIAHIVSGKCKCVAPQVCDE